MIEWILGIAFYGMMAGGVMHQAYLDRPEEFHGFNAYLIAAIIGLIWPFVLGVAIAKAAR